MEVNRDVASKSTPKCCVHNGARRYHCREHGTGYCIHNILKYNCSQCYVTRKQKKLLAPDVKFCIHNGVRRYCCKTCVHKVRKSRCIECSPNAFCKHRVYKYFCKECGTSHCEHNYQKHNCPECFTGIYKKKK